MKKQIKAIFALFAICLVTALLLALANALTAPMIKKAEDAAANAALLEVLPNGEEFEKIDLSGFELPATVAEAYSEKNGGKVFKLVTAGYSPDLIIMCGINADGSVSGALCLSSGETLGYEKTYGESLKGATDATINDIDTISGATKTTAAYRSAVLDAINAFKILGGESVDIRTEEEILADNLNSMLPSAEGKFTLMLLPIETDFTMYKADNNTGYVCELNETFLALDSNGLVTSECNDDTRQHIEEDAKKIIELAIDLSQYNDIPGAVKKATYTEDGNFLLEIYGSGYGINGDWGASGEHIIIRITITSEGKIINCVTVSQSESKDYGAACADPEFYTQFNGKTEDNYADIDAIGGATMTTNGYKTAVLRAFEAVKILTGGANNE